MPDDQSIPINGAPAQKGTGMEEAEKIRLISQKFGEIMEALGLDLSNDSLKNTPHRVAKMYVQEVFMGLNPRRKPKMTLFENTYEYGEMVHIGCIEFHSMCEHHFMPFFGKAHVAYIPGSKVAGLSKFNRLVDYHARRPQVQERLTIEIAEDLSATLGTPSVAVLMEAKHLCVAARGAEDDQSITTTARYLGRFGAETELRREFLSHIKR